MSYHRPSFQLARLINFLLGDPGYQLEKIIVDADVFSSIDISRKKKNNSHTGGKEHSVVNRLAHGMDCKLISYNNRPLCHNNNQAKIIIYRITPSYQVKFNLKGNVTWYAYRSYSTRNLKHACYESRQHEKRLNIPFKFNATTIS